MKRERAPHPSPVPPPPATSAGLPWASVLDSLLGRRCRAVLEPEPGHGRWADFGRCELRRHPRSVDHALERGMYDVRWSTVETDGAGIPLPELGERPALVRLQDRLWREHHDKLVARDARVELPWDEILFKAGVAAAYIARWARS